MHSLIINSIQLLLLKVLLLKVIFGVDFYLKCNNVISAKFHSYNNDWKFRM